MRSVIVFMLCFLSFFVNAQHSCEKAIELRVDSLALVTDFGEITYFKIKKDFIYQSFNVSGNYEKVVVNPSECGLKIKEIKIGSNGITSISDELIDAGYCSCATCLKRNSEVNLNNDSLVFVKFIGAQSIKLELNKAIPKQKKKWFERELVKGDKIRLKNILFVGGEARFRAVSYKDLNQLLAVMNAYPNLKILVEGHVNSPGKRNTNTNQVLSTQRAEAVVKYLIKKGIRESRLSFIGFGNTKMIYPNTKLEYEMQFNRRVEILVQ